MHLNAKLPVLMPQEHWKEFEKLSKAALLDIVWDYATRTVGEEEGADHRRLFELRRVAETIVRLRSQK